MKTVNAFLAKLIYRLFFYLDGKLGYVERYDYETAPYCGHHYNGHNGKFTSSSYHEGDGGAKLNFKNPFLKIYYENFEGNEYCWVAPVIATKLTLTLDGKSWSTTKYGLKGIIAQRKVAKKAKVEAKGLITSKIRYSIA